MEKEKKGGIKASEYVYSISHTNHTETKLW